MPEFMEVLTQLDETGYRRVRRFSEAEVAGLLDLMSNKSRMPAHKQEYLLKEVITTTSFADLFGFITERDLMARFRAVVPDWLPYCPIGKMPNFNQGEKHKVLGNTGLLPRVAQKGEYLPQAVSDSHYHRQVFKRGAQFDISWEAVINDMLGAFEDLPQRFSDAASYTRAYIVTDAICSAAGPDAGLFGAPIVDVDGANVTNQGVLPLTIGNLEITLGLMAGQTDVVTGRPLGTRGAHLVVPQTLEMTARAILTSAKVQWTEVGAGAGIAMPTDNVLPQLGLVLHVNPLLQVIDVSGTNDTTWYLFANPSEGQALQMDLLRGHEDPEICMKASDKVTVGGDMIDPFAGDFASDNIFYRVRDVHGAAQLDPRFAYAQVGP